MRKWVRFGAVSTLVFCVIMVGGGLFDNNLTGIDRLCAFALFVPVGIGCFFLFRQFGVWDRAAWATMSDGRKALLFLVTLPGALFAAVTVGIIVLAVSAFLGGAGNVARSEVREARRAELRSDIKTAVDKEFKRHGL
jgi:ABC-type multidrug transport system permease subunit